MRYVPNLIPNQSKVLPDYFKGGIYKAAKRNPARDILLWIIGVFFFTGALAFINHPLLLILFGLLGFLIIPPGHRFIERQLQFRLTPKIKTITAAALFTGAMPLAGHYAMVDTKAEQQQKVADEKATQDKEVADSKEQVRKDSLAYYVNQIHSLGQNHRLNEANQQVQHALVFAVSSEERQQVENESVGLKAISTYDLVKAGKYQTALPELNALLSANPGNNELIYNRAVCYSKTGKIQEAVTDLKSLMQNGNSEAETLHDKINPVRKRVIGYETLCCDGTTSNAKGQGACSHHGGVCNWDQPIYEEYRKYE